MSERDRNTQCDLHRSIVLGRFAMAANKCQQIGEMIQMYSGEWPVDWDEDMPYVLGLAIEDLKVAHASLVRLEQIETEEYRALRQPEERQAPAAGTDTAAETKGGGM